MARPARRILLLRVTTLVLGVVGVSRGSTVAPRPPAPTVERIAFNAPTTADRWGEPAGGTAPDADGTARRLLTRDEEVALAREVGKVRELEAARSRLCESLGVAEADVGAAAWAAAAGLDEAQLLERKRRGEDARAALTSANMRLVAHAASRFRYAGLAREDLLQEGAFGLSRAVERFDPDRGFRFSTYATFWIRQALLRACAEQSRVIRLPAHVHDQVAQLRKATTELYKQLGRDATDDEVAARLDATREKLDFLRACDRIDPHSLEAAHALSATKVASSAGGGSTTIAESLACGESRPEEVVARNARHEYVAGLMSETLDDRERDVLELSFGLGGASPVTKTEIARRMRVSRERVRQIEVRALNKLRATHRTRDPGP